MPNSVNFWSFGDLVKLVLEGTTVIGASAAILIRMGYHKRQHQDSAAQLDKLQKEHDSRLAGCPPIGELKEALHEFSKQQDRMDQKMDTILGYLQGKGLKIKV